MTIEAVLRRIEKACRRPPDQTCPGSPEAIKSAISQQIGMAYKCWEIRDLCRQIRKEAKGGK
jgi:hypothetical protein